MLIYTTCCSHQGECLDVCIYPYKYICFVKLTVFHVIFFYAHIYRGILAWNFLVPPLVGFSLYVGSPCTPQPSTITVDYTIGFIKHEPLDFGWAFIVWIPCMFSQNLNIYIYIYPNLSQLIPTNSALWGWASMPFFAHRKLSWRPLPLNVPAGQWWTVGLPTGHPVPL